MNFPHLIVVLATLFDVVHNEAVALESSLLEVLAEMNAALDIHEKRFIQFKKDLDLPTPAFMALPGVGKGRIRQNDRMVFRDVKLNVNGCYKSSSSVFEAPVSGTYYFALMLQQDRDVEYVYYYQDLAADIVSGDGQKVLGFLYHRNNSTNQLRTIYTLARLDAGENVWIRCASVECKYLSWDYAPSAFLGFLVHG